jgi:hypothetical protein
VTLNLVYVIIGMFVAGMVFEEAKRAPWDFRIAWTIFCFLVWPLVMLIGIVDWLLREHKRNHEKR